MLQLSLPLLFRLLPGLLHTHRCVRRRRLSYERRFRILICSSHEQQRQLDLQPYQPHQLFSAIDPAIALVLLRTTKRRVPYDVPRRATAAAAPRTQQQLTVDCWCRFSLPRRSETTGAQFSIETSAWFESRRGNRWAGTSAMISRSAYSRSDPCGSSWQLKAGCKTRLLTWAMRVWFDIWFENIRRRFLFPILTLTLTLSLT